MRKVCHVTLLALIAVGLAVGPALSKASKGSKRAWLGVYSQSVSHEIAEAFDLPVDYGVIVNEVVKRSPAEKAGLQEDDIIIEFDGSKVTDQEDLVEVIEDRRPGDEVTLIVMRDDDKLELPVILKKRPADKRARAFKAPRTKSYSYSFVFGDERSYIGVSLMDLNRQLGEFFGAEKGKGALITEVHEDSPAEEAGLKAGDVIVAIDGDKVIDAEDVKEAVLDKDPGDKVDVTVLRNKKEMAFSVEVTENEDAPHFYSNKQFPDPDIFFVPKLKSLLDKSLPDFDDDLHLDLDLDFEDFQEEMEMLKDELKALKEEMKQLREKLE